ncbi:MAG: OsmC family protein [Clostridia bacterium]|nr:OsmC family protein [Clostridia bacterium]
MERKEVSLVFSNGFNGELIAPNGTCRIGAEKDTLAPYDMLFGALASCLYSTFLDVAEKKRINYDRVEMVVTGEKRDEIPATLKWVKVKAVVFNAEKELGLEQSFKLATEYCSIYETISKVAEMSYEIHFEYEK